SHARMNRRLLLYATPVAAPLLLRGPVAKALMLLPCEHALKAVVPSVAEVVTVRPTLLSPLLKPLPSKVCDALMPASITPTVMPWPCALFQAVGIVWLVKFHGSNAFGVMVV